MSGREYPRRPIAAVGAFIVRDDGRILMVRRAHDPGAGEWSIPGGAIELGETSVEAVKREVREEVGIGISDPKLIDIYDSILRDSEGRIRYHYVIIEYVARPLSLSIEPSGEVLEYRWLSLGEIMRMETVPSVKVVIRRNMETFKKICRGV